MLGAPQINESARVPDSLGRRPFEQYQKELCRAEGIGQCVMTCIVLDAEMGQPLIQSPVLTMQLRKKRRANMRRVHPQRPEAQAQPVAQCTREQGGVKLCMQCHQGMASRIVQECGERLLRILAVKLCSPADAMNKYVVNGAGLLLTQYDLESAADDYLSSGNRASPDG